ncbi:MAG: glycine cleavage system protein GcvH [Candidatus Kaelpia aquatica]|nr:glycine cleavage system protein GcvH [Candidatus Kaelpia aquatica]
MDPIEGLLYTKEHEWVKIEGNRARIGITDYAQGLLGDITFIELPKMGDNLEQFKPFSSVDSVKAASDIFAPLSGEVIEVNEVLNSRPELLNSSSYGDGWVVAVEIKDESEKDNLMDVKAYKSYLEEVSD